MASITVPRDSTKVVAREREYQLGRGQVSSLHGSSPHSWARACWRGIDAKKLVSECDKMAHIWFQTVPDNITGISSSSFCVTSAESATKYWYLGSSYIASSRAGIIETKAFSALQGIQCSVWYFLRIFLTTCAFALNSWHSLSRLKVDSLFL